MVQDSYSDTGSEMNPMCNHIVAKKQISIYSTILCMYISESESVYVVADVCNYTDLCRHVLIYIYILFRMFL